MQRKVTLDGQTAEDGPLVTEDLVEASRHSIRKALIKMLITAIVMTGAILVLHAGPVRTLLSDVQSWKLLLGDAGIWGPFLFVMAAAVLISAGFPRLWLSAIAGAVFGFKIGFPTSWVASGIGAFANFAFARWGAHDAAQRLFRSSSRLQGLLNHPTFLSVVLVRQLPVWGMAQNIALALTRIRPRTYILGTACGILPSTVVFVLIGSGIGKASLGEALRNIASAILIMAVIAGGLFYFRNRQQSLRKESA